LSRAPKVNTGRRAPGAPDSSTVGLVGARRSRGGCDISGRCAGADPACAAAAVGKAITKRITSAAVATKGVVTPPARRETDAVSVDKRAPFREEGKQVVAALTAPQPDRARADQTYRQNPTDRNHSRTAVTDYAPIRTRLQGGESATRAEGSDQVTRAGRRPPRYRAATNASCRSRATQAPASSHSPAKRRVSTADRKRSQHSRIRRLRRHS
jgi:hypothetical protein